MVDVSDPLWKARLDGWQIDQNGAPIVVNVVGFDALPTHLYAAVALKFVRSQEHLDAVKKGQTAPDTFQFSLNQVAARKLGETLLAVAAQMDAEAPPKENQN